MPSFVPRPKRNLATPTNDATNEDIHLPPQPLIDILRGAHQRNRGKGWRRKDLGFEKSRTKDDRFVSQFLRDYHELEGILSGAAALAGVRPNAHNIHDRVGKFKKRSRVHNPLSKSYLAFAWGVGKNYGADLVNGRARPLPGVKAARKPNSVNLCVIDSQEAATLRYTAEFLFVQDYVRQKSKANNQYAYEDTRAMEKSWREEAKARWSRMSEVKKRVWYKEQRDHDERQPLVRDQIIESLQANGAKSYRAVAEDIGYWCCASTIQKWLSSQDTYCKYVQRNLPLLSSRQMDKHVVFAKLILNNWNLPRGWYLWMHFDEKWFWGLVLRAYAKACEMLGLDKQDFYAHHKSHIDKVMAVAIVGYAFNTNVENGGRGLKIGLFRCQGARIAKKLQ
jgi:hypothetical protein